MPNALAFECEDILKSGRAGFRDGLVLFPESAAYADSSHHLLTAFKGKAAGKNHDTSVIGDVYPEELIAGLAVLGQILGGDIEGAGGPRFVDRNIDAADPRAVHADVRHQISAGIHHSDIHRL